MLKELNELDLVFSSILEIIPGVTLIRDQPLINVGPYDAI